MAFHALADYQNHVIGWLQWEQSSLGAMSLSLLKFVGQASLVDDAMLPS